MHPQRSLEESFLTVYNMLPNHQTCKKWYETAECSETEENDEWSLFLQVKLKNTQVKHTPSKISWRELSNSI